MGLLSRGSAWQAGRLAASESITVTLQRRGASDTVVTAVPGRTMIEQDNGDGTFTRFETRDYLIAVDDYIFDGVLCEPQDGDCVVEVIDDVSRTYAALPIAGEACGRHTDQNRVMWRVHTKLRTKTARILTQNQLRCLLGLMPIPGNNFDTNEVRHMGGIVSLAA